MGRDKALVEVDGVPMLRRVAVALRRAGATHVACVGSAAEGQGDGGDGDARRRGALQGLDVPAVADDHPGEGPLGGVLTALRTAPAGVELVLVVACDLLAPSPTALRATVTALAIGGGDVAVPDVADVAGRQPAWHHAAWHRRAEGPLRAQFEAGERSLRRAVAAAGLDVVRVEGIDPEACADADEPGDLPGG